jgi:hypothetical protein
LRFISTPATDNNVPESTEQADKAGDGIDREHEDEEEEKEVTSTSVCEWDECEVF